MVRPTAIQPTFSWNVPLLLAICQVSVDAMVCISQSGFCVAYLIFIGENVSHVLSGSTAEKIPVIAVAGEAPARPSSCISTQVHAPGTHTSCSLYRAEARPCPSFHAAQLASYPLSVFRVCPSLQQALSAGSCGPRSGCADLLVVDTLAIKACPLQVRTAFSPSALRHQKARHLLKSLLYATPPSSLSRPPLLCLSLGLLFSVSDPNSLSLPPVVCIS